MVSVDENAWRMIAKCLRFSFHGDAANKRRHNCVFDEREETLAPGKVYQLYLGYGGIGSNER
jgi:hypothetical protein